MISPAGERPKHIHLRDPVDERLLPGRDIAAVPRVLGAGKLRVKQQREGVKAEKGPGETGTMRRGEPLHWASV